MTTDETTHQLQFEIPGSPARSYGPEHAPVVIGRDESVGVRIVHELVSRKHARFVWDDGWYLEDLHSTNGTWCDGVRVNKVAVHARTSFRLGDPHTGPEIRLASATGQATPAPVTGAPARWVVGRDPDCDLPLDDPMVSWRHAAAERDGDGWVIRDLRSTNQTIVNGVPVRTQRLRPGDRVLIGNTSLEFDGSTFLEVTASRFVVERATLALRNGRRIVDGVTFAINNPSLVAVIGPSGAGKSSLLRLVTGQLPPSDGTVSLDGATMTSQRRAHRGQIGVVPQHTVAHKSLTAQQALEYTARLRLPGDVSRSERAARIAELLGELGLTDHAHTRISRLSGGQQRRVAIALEMLTDPSMLILDEPTAGLDPSLVLQIMRLLRSLADQGKRVFVVTHDLEHLALVDHVLILRNGGTVAYYGPPADVFQHFGTTSWAETFELLGRPTDELPRPPGGGERDRVTSVEAYSLPETRLGLGGLARSVWVVLMRQLRLIAADPLYAALLVGMPLALGCLAVAVPGSDGFTRPRDPTSAEAARLLVLMIVGAAFLGLAGAIRDLVGEREIFEHERDAGLSPLGYLASKVCVFSSMAIVQCAVLVGFVLLFRAAPADPLVLHSGAAELFVATVATALTGVVLGLAVSSRVGTTEQTMPPLVLLVMAQLVMCGGLFPIDGRGPLAYLSLVVPTRWGYAAAASTVDLNGLSPGIDPDDLWVHTARNWAGCMLMLVLLALVLLAVAARGVVRRRRIL